MQHIDGFALYKMGHEVHALWDIKPGDDYKEWVLPMRTAMEALSVYLKGSAFQPEFCLKSGADLYKVLRQTVEQGDQQQFDSLMSFAIKGALIKFESNLAAELGRADLYLILKKNGFNTSDLVFDGKRMFPVDLIAKVPEAELDVKSSMRCIALSLPTAAGFHLHRLNESVLHRYWDAVTEGAPRPPKGQNNRRANMGDYLVELDRINKGDEKVKAALRSLKDLHRNPLMHPEESLESIDEAIALHGAVFSVLVPMLARIPDESPAELVSSGLMLTPEDKVVRIPIA